MREMMKSVLRTMRAFARNKRGNVAMMFGLCLVPLTIAAGVGVDFFRASMVRNAMSEALDAAALAVGSTSGLTSANASTLAQQYFNANYKGATSEGTPTCCTVTYNSTGSVTVSATDQMPASLLKIAGYTQLPVTASSTVVWGQSKLWVALVLDNSGSMSQGDSSGSKMTALQNASNQLLTILQNASTNAGDVQVSIVPFVKNVNMGYSSFASTNYIDWTDWSSPPLVGTVVQADTTAMPVGGDVLKSFGPGDSCPYDGSDGYVCSANPTNDSNCSTGGYGQDCISTIASSGSYKGYICPSMHAGGTTDGLGYHYYNGCWTGSTWDNSYTTVSTGSSASCSGHSSSNCSCTGSNGSKSCKTKNYPHTWVSNNHNTWGGCVMDRQRKGITTNGASSAAAVDYDITNTAPVTTTPDSQFPAENNLYCNSSTVTPLGYNWTTLSNQINAMTAYGATNQAIGMEHGWQTLTPGAPYGAPTVPSNTSRYIIVVSDGLNTLDRWWGDGSTEGTTNDGYIDARMNSVCAAAKADGITVYSIYVNIGGTDGNSAPLQNCATDSTKYFALTTTSAVVTTFNQIAQQITNVRVSK